MSTFWTGFMNFVQIASFFLFLILALICIYLASGISRANRKMNRLKRRYDALFRGEDDLDIEELLNKHNREIEQQSKTIAKLIKDQKNMEQKLSDAMQKQGLVKYNAFDDLTNELSYSLALLDGDSNGIIITSLYGRSQSTSFAKVIRQGKATVELSEYEKKALEIALGK
ncbi:MAG: DUF4446 family protein [Tissierellia bacterium]|nr:DUF4446 family protein [Tissierellia bacterium]